MKEVFPEPILKLCDTGAKHFGKIFVGYVDITFFNEKDRYQGKKSESW